MNDIWKQMVGGGRYDANHRELVARRERTRNLLWEYNMLPPSLKTELNALIDRIIGSHGKTYDIIQPFRCDYGDNISFGENFFANFNLTILDEAKVTIGDNVFIGPNVSLYTACHPLDPDDRNSGIEWALPITIGNSVWIGGNVTVLPGVTIGDNVVIGAGSVVTKSFASNCVIAGNPAAIIRYLTPTENHCSATRDEENPTQLGLDSCGD